MQTANSDEPGLDLPEELERHRPVVRAYALTLTRANGDEDDLVQETFYRALKIHASGREIRKPRAYLMSLLHNVFIDSCRAAQPQDPEAVEEIAAVDSQTLHQTCREVLQAIAKLPVEQRRLLLLAGVEGHSYADLSKKLGVAEGTITSRLSRARAALRARVGWDETVISALR